MEGRPKLYAFVLSLFVLALLIGVAAGLTHSGWSTAANAFAMLALFDAQRSALRRPDSTPGPRRTALALALLPLSLVGVAYATSAATTLVGRLGEILIGLGVLLTAASVSRELVRARD